VTFDSDIKVTTVFKVKYLKTVHFRDKVTISLSVLTAIFPVYRMVPLSMTSDPEFNVTTFLDIQYLRNNTR